MFGVCSMIVSAAMTERAHPGLDSCRIITLIMLQVSLKLCSEVLNRENLC